MKNIGIWLDLKNAFIIEGNNIIKVDSSVEDFHLHGGYGGSTPYNGQNATSETKLLEREKHQLSHYFDAIMEIVEGADKILIFGPAQTKNELLKAIKNNSKLRNKDLKIETADNMTENQLKEFVREYYQ